MSVPTGVQYGHIRMVGGYPILYQYRMTFQDQTAYKFVVPVLDAKGKMRFYKGYTPEEAIAAYRKDLSKGKLYETTLKLAKAKECLSERRGMLWSERWEVVNLKDLGTFDPAMDDNLVESAEEAVKDLVKAH